MTARSRSCRSRQRLHDRTEDLVHLEFLPNGMGISSMRQSCTFIDYHLNCTLGSLPCGVWAISLLPMGNSSLSKAKIIYFDQCAMGDLLAANPTNVWVEIMDLLRHGLSSGSIIFPLSLEHLLELSADSMRDAALLRRDAMYAMSRGVCFFHPERVVAANLWALNSGHELVLDNVLGIMNQQFWTSDMGSIGEVRQRAERAYLQGTLFLNQITNPTARLSEEMKSEILRIHESRPRESFEKLLKLLNAHELLGADSNIVARRQRQLWAFEGGVFDAYCALAGSPEGISSLRNVLVKYNDADIPVIDVGRQLSLSFNLRQLKRRTNDYFDFSRLQVAIPYADIVVTDKAQLAAVEDRGLHGKYQTKVFSCRPKFLDELVEAIRLVV